MADSYITQGNSLSVSEIFLKISKIIGLIIGVVQLASAVTLILGMHTMLGVFATALPGGEQGIEIQFTDPVVIPFELSPRNDGFLEATMSVRVSMVVDGEEITSDSASVVILPGAMVPMELKLLVSLSDAQEYFQEGVDLEMRTEIYVSTLYDLISFNNDMTITGGMQ